MPTTIHFVVCAFCNSNSTEVEVMIHAPENNSLQSDIAICDRCVAGCVKLIAEYRQTQALPAPVVLDGTDPSAETR